MADQSDVEIALEAGCIATLYSSGSFPAASVTGAPVRVYRGWPVAKALNDDLGAGTVNISIWPLPTSRNTTRHLIETIAQTPGTVTLLASISGAVVTISGTSAAGQVIGVLCAGFAYAYRLLGTETPSSIAAIFAVAIPGAVSSGAVLTLPTDQKCSVQVVADATVSTEYGRMAQEFQMTIWAPTPQARDLVASLLIPPFVQLSWLALPNNESGRIRIISQMTTDKTENAGQFRRDIRFQVDYPVTVVEALPCMLFEIGTITVAAGTVATFGAEMPPTGFSVDANGDLVIDQSGAILATAS